MTNHRNLVSSALHKVLTRQHRMHTLRRNDKRAKGRASYLTLETKGRASYLTLETKGRASYLTLETKGRASYLTLETKGRASYPPAYE